MSVVEISDIGAPQLSGGLNGITITRKLKAQVSSLDDGPVTVRAHASCPREGQAYSFRGESDSSFVCNAISIEAKSDSIGLERGLVYDVSATYSNTVNTGSLGEDEENPLDDPPSIEYSWTVYQRPALVDVDGNLVKNGADEAFDPPWMMDEHRPVVTITRNEASFSVGFATEYQDAVNEDAFGGSAAGTAKMSVSARSATRGDYDYWIVTYEIEFKWEGWNPSGIPARGYRYRKSASAVPENYIDASTGQPPAEPIYLKLDGTKNKSLNEQLAENGDPPEEGGDEIFPYLHEFNFYRTKAFGPLNLGI